MKKVYITPEWKFISVILNRDILGDSNPEPIDNPIIDEPIDDGFF